MYNTDSVNFEGSDEDKAKVKVENSTATEGFVADENGHVTGLKVVNVASGENGPFTRQPGTERVIPADLVLISVGFLHPDTTTLVDQLPVDLDGRGNVARNDKFATSQDGVFACGDAGRGPEPRRVGHLRRSLLRCRGRRVPYRLHRTAGTDRRFQASDDAAAIDNIVVRV